MSERLKPSLRPRRTVSREMRTATHIGCRIESVKGVGQRGQVRLRDLSIRLLSGAAMAKQRRHGPPYRHCACRDAGNIVSGSTSWLKARPRYQ